MDIKSIIENYKGITEEEKISINKYIDKLENVDIKCFEMVNILIKAKADYYSILSGLLLNEFRKDNSIIKNIDLPEICVTILTTILKIEKINIVNEEISTENIKNLLISIANDIRVIIVKLADVLISAKFMDDLTQIEADNLHLLIKELYAPISARLGLSIFKSELQDLNIKYFYKEEYKKISEELDDLIQNREEEIQININKLENMLKDLNIDGQVYGRVKHISSIFNKLKDKNYSLAQIYDLLAVRIIVNTESECYTVLSNINSIYKPIDGRFKDYIIRPKANGYKSIHTTVITESNDPLEIQIRTKAMHEFAEYGVAAHFLYKEKKSKNTSLDDKLTWVRKMLESTDFSTASDFLDELKTDLYSNEIFVQTPLGKVISLKENSTPIDFAYAIHSDIGNKCVGSKVNGKIVPLSYHLKNGDVVEIITNANSHGPSRDWLKIVNTNQARNKLNSFFKKEMKEDNIKKGKSIIEATCKAKHVELKNLLVEDWLKELFDKWSLKNLDDLFASVGYGALTSTQVVNKLLTKYKETQKTEESIKEKTVSKQVENNKGIVFENNLKGLMVRFAKCCSPVPGDEILGFVSQGRGVTIHAKDCCNVKNFNPERIISAKFTNVSNKKFNAKISIIANKTNNIIVNVTKVITENKIDLTGVNVNNIDSNLILLKVSVDVKDITELQSLIHKLEAIKEVVDVKREKGD
ncbi:MAG: bifunctional (p)ppGpp synthetase/guanosine-3',5'-bis(diphosphate) 3'-pyrophosphohydrolase [Clostridiales bacterium]|nr:bifunctional (p)ppGpp synthetase/guanosine-3',5'-bis(diphosphate) 3'-pyrophosphohydrolase [Clostridiales bacterium]